MATLFTPKLGPGLNRIVAAGQGGLEHLTFSVLQLGPGDSYLGRTGADECVGVVLAGQCDFDADGLEPVRIGDRQSVFAGRAWAFYLSKESTYRLRADGGVTVALVSAQAEKRVPSYLIPPQDVRVVDTGADHWRREVHNIVGPERPASRLLVGETFNRPGSWSGSPPHRHERDNYPEEVDLEEVYYFKLCPAQGFGVQVVYTDDRSVNQAFVLRDDSTVAIPEGYHPVVGGPGYRIYYLWMMAGQGRLMAPRDDPDHAWLKSCEPILRSARPT